MKVKIFNLEKLFNALSQSYIVFKFTSLRGWGTFKLSNFRLIIVSSIYLHGLLPSSFLNNIQKKKKKALNISNILLIITVLLRLCLSLQVFKRTVT